MFMGQPTKKLQDELATLRAHRDRLVRQGTVTPRSLDGHMSRLQTELRNRRVT